MKRLFKNKLVILAFGLFSAFLAAMVLVLTGMTDSFDKSVVEVIYKFRGSHSEHSGAFYFINRILTEFGYIYVLIPSCILALFVGKGRLKVWFFSLGTGIVWTINECLKHIILRARPEEIYHLMVENSTSFPSGHTITSTYFYLFLAYIIINSNLGQKWKKPLAIISFVMPFLIGVTRLNLTVHYLSDVVAGWCLGGAFVCVAIVLLEYFQNKKILNKNVNAVKDK